jgi:hypothetical protein
MADTDLLEMPPAIAPDEGDEERKRRLLTNAQGMPPARPPEAATTPASTPTMPAAVPAASSRSEASSTPLAQPSMPPAGRADMAGPSLSATGQRVMETMPAAPTGPAQQRLEDLQAQPRPELHGWKKVLDVIGQMHPIGRAIEQNIPGSPQFYDTAVQRAAGQAGLEQKTQEGQQRSQENQQTIEKNAAAAQFDTPAKREQYMEDHPDQFEGVSDFQKNDWKLSGKFPQKEPPEDQSGKTPEEVTIHDLMTGDNGQPRVNPDTGKPYSYLDAYGAVKGAAQGAKPGKHSSGEVKLDEGIPTGIYGDKDKLWRAGDPGMPPDLKAALDDANKAHGQSFSEKERLQQAGRAITAGSRAVNMITPDGTMQAVNGEDLPKFMKDHPGSVEASAGASVQAMGRQALIGDIRRAANNVRGNLSVLDSGLFDRAKLASALADPNSTPGQFLQSFPRAASDDKTQQFISDLYSLREQAMAMRSVLGAGQGSEDLRRAILQTLPGVGSPSSGFGEKQINNLLQALDTLERGVPKVPGRGGEAKDFGAAPEGKKEGSTGTMKVDGKDVKIVIRNGRIIAQ